VEAVIFIGVQAAGKTTFYRRRFFRTHVRINLDMLRSRRREALLVRACLEAGQPFVIDNTNPTAADRARYVPPARAARFRVVGYHFQPTLREALARNAGRPAAERVPEAAVRGTFRRLQAPSPEEGFDALYRVGIDEAGEFVVREWRDEDA
jgi:predicted kinase